MLDFSTRVDKFCDGETVLMQTCIMRARDECREREREGERKEQALPNGCFSFPDTERPKMSPQPKLPSRESKGVRRLQGKEKKKEPRPNKPQAD